MATTGGVVARGGREVERLRRQVEVMLAYALDKGLTPAPQAWMFEAVRERPAIDLGGDGWTTPLPETDPRSSTDALVRAHRDLSRLVAPARPATLELLQSYREGRRARTVRIPRQQPKPGTSGPGGAPGGASAGAPAPKLQLRRPRLPGIGSTVPLVRWLMIATLVFLVLFVLLAANPAARQAISGTQDTGVSDVPERSPGNSDQQPVSVEQAAHQAPSRAAAGANAGAAGAAGVAGAADAVARPAALNAVDSGSSFSHLLLRELFLLCAAGLGACLTALYRASREVARGTYDPEFDHTFVQRIVLGMVSGLVLAELLPFGDGSASLVLPAVALVGGFAASVVHRVLNRLVSAVEALFSGDPDEQEDARRELAAKRAEEVLAQAERSNLATLLEIRRIAASGAPTRAVIDEIDRMIIQGTPS